jgi:O-antigen/teichoic acid export membrane protein
MSQRKIGALLSYLNIIVKNLVVLMYTPILLRYLGQSQYGLYQMANSVIGTLSILSLGFASAYVRFYSQMKVKEDEDGIKKLNGMYLLLFSAMAGLAVISGLILILNVQNIFAQGLLPEEIALTKTLMIVMVANVALAFPSSVFDSYIMVYEQFKFQRSRQLFQSILVPLLTIPLLMKGFGALSVVMVSTFITVIFLFLNISFAVRRLKMRFVFRDFQFPLLKQIAVFSFWIFLNQIFEIINNNAPNFILGMFSGTKSIAVFAIAAQIKNVFISISTALSGIFVPKINQLVAEKTDDFELTKLMTKVGRYQMILHCFLLGGFIVVGKYFIQLWAGKEYLQSYLIAVLLVTPMIAPLTQNAGIEIQRAKNKHRFRSLVYLVFAIMNLVITCFLVPTWGALGPTIGYMIYVAIGTGVIMNWYYQKHIGIDIFYFWKKNLPVIVTAAVSTVLMLGVQYFVPVDSLGRFLWMGSLYAGIFMGIFFKFVILEEEAQLVRTILVTRIVKRRE